MLKNFYNSFCVPLMLINSEVYTFISGILISLSTNVFTTLCFEKFVLSTQWHLYLSTIMYAIAGALCIYLAYKMSGFQNYIKGKQILDSDEQKAIVKDVTSTEYKRFSISYISLIISVLSGTVLLIINYAYLA